MPVDDFVENALVVKHKNHFIYRFSKMKIKGSLPRIFW